MASVFVVNVAREPPTKWWFGRFAESRGQFKCIGFGVFYLWWWWWWWRWWSLGLGLFPKRDEVAQAEGRVAHERVWWW